MTNNVFQKLASDFKFEWDLDDLTSQFGPEIFHGSEVPKYFPDDESRAYFQTFDVGLGTSINFWRQFEKECSDVVDKVKKLQQEVRLKVDSGEYERTELIELLLKKQVRVNDIIVLKMKANQGAMPHIDRRRTKALNIGIKLSSACQTLLRPDSNIVEDFYTREEPPLSYTMNDGDVYLVDVGVPHAVKSNMPDLPDTRYRYILTINLVRTNWGS